MLVRIAIPDGELLLETVDAPPVDVEVEALRGDPDALEALRIEAFDRGGRLEVVVEAPFASASGSGSDAVLQRARRVPGRRSRRGGVCLRRPAGTRRARRRPDEDRVR